MDKHRMPFEQRVEIAVPAFLRNDVTDILSIGKSVQIIKSFNPNFESKKNDVIASSKTLDSDSIEF